MFTQSEIADGTQRLISQRLNKDDRKMLKAIFLLYLKNRASAFSDLGDRLAAVNNTNDERPASILAALLIAFEEKGFSLSDLKGGRSGLQTDKKGELAFKTRFGLTLLEYELPEDFNGNFDSANSGGCVSGVTLFPSITVKKTGGW